ncbi:hypothetical protein KR51_00023860 [Rubidibacter lacunae KORDI 51-2]|uniref:Uncharacterized protein n=1 Tax=Rubidibacter lacunae KORDI 51-2 TaxID=582515 RepID=U5D973_9CHRO|nr:hypothetical protein [Rubidibacter lacunae]ERN41123.1 hypothetical protein KR51_00023860 [Rubidibacter lacunae KORDI 51-2]
MPLKLHALLTVVLHVAGKLTGLVGALYYGAWLLEWLDNPPPLPGRLPTPLVGLILALGMPLFILLGGAIPVQICKRLLPARCPSCGGATFAFRVNPRFSYCCRSCSSVRSVGFKLARSWFYR